MVNQTAVSLVNQGLNPSPVADQAAVLRSGQIQDAPPMAATPVTSVDGKRITPGTGRSSRGGGNSEPIQPATHLAGGQLASQAPEIMAQARSGAGGVAGVAGEPAGASTHTASETALKEPFAALDAEVAPGRTAWIHAGTQRAEAGYQDPDLGWIGVRADATGGGVHAQLVPGSADAALTLGSHMAGLNTYLAEHHTQIETVTVSAPEGGWTGLGSDKGAGEGMQQGAGNQSGQEAAQSTGSSSQSSSTRSLGDPSPAVVGQAASTVDLNAGALPGRPGGVHISVMA
jgi:hypothetical protein